MKHKTLSWLCGVMVVSMIAGRAGAAEPAQGSYEWFQRQEDYRQRWERLMNPPEGSSGLYAAIAYSMSTGDWAYSYGWSSRGRAESEALRRCRGVDAKVVCWVFNGYCALAEAADQSCYATAWGPNRSTAEQLALRRCQEKTGQPCKVVLSVFSK